jgi:glucosyl-dolichyl phosphate glucuronosyltransferase
MLVTVAICTWNHANLLDQTLTEMRNLRIPEGVEWEILIVNNNCTDATEEVIARHATDLPIRRVIELRQGLSCARNRVLDEANGDWVLFTDDDVLVDPGLLEAYVAAIVPSGEDVAFLGGTIEPWFPQPPDPDLARAIPTVANGFCGVGERGVIVREDRPIQRLGDEVPLGANFAVDRRRLGKIRFDEALGHRGNSLICGEEVYFFRALLDKGLTGRWVTAARVRHYVPPSRLTLSYLRRHLFDLGRTSILMNGIPSIPSRLILFGVPGWIWREATEDCLRIIVNNIVKDKYSYYRSIARFSMRSGMIYQYLLNRSRMRA